MKKIHPIARFPHFIHGADYNPEQWLHDKSVWDEDMELMNKAFANEMTVGIFSWAKLEPVEGEYDFSFLDEIIEKIGRNGKKVILSTPSGARPHWMADKYPEVLRVDQYGNREHFRARENHCFTSPVYREKVREINRRLALRYKDCDTVIAWHISNEFNGECHCELCKDAFRNFLREKFHNDINELNLNYWSTFWSHTYDSFDQIEPPGKNTETGIHGLNLDWKRFVTYQTGDFIKNELIPLREITPHLPVTTNMMFEFYDIDYRKFTDIIDFASWDSYPEWHSRDDAEIASVTAFWHDLYRTLMKKPFLLMESTPSLVNWKPYNKMKRPGLDTLSSIQAIAHGSDSVQYFQWRKSRGSSEKFHGAVVGHDGTDNTKVFRSVRATGKTLSETDEIAGTLTDSKVAVIFDWENMWALDDSQGYAKDDKKYFETCYEYHRVFWERGLDCDVVSPKDDLSKYRLVVAPMLYLTDKETVSNLKKYVENGGILYATYMLGTVDENDLCYLKGIPANELKEVFGIVAEEVDTLYPHESYHCTLNGETHTLCDYIETVNLAGADKVCEYTDGYYKSSPTLTKNTYGKGQAYYQAARDEGSFKRSAIGNILNELCIESPLNMNGKLPKGATAHTRTDGETAYVFLENYSESDTATFSLKHEMTDMLTGEKSTSFTVGPYSFRILKTK
ncbi:MAG: beta-galactosidase [Clostridia bacterium]|nr:beta-galactosidase [Clostridia bacterium]